MSRAARSLVLVLVACAAAAPALEASCFRRATLRDGAKPRLTEAEEAHLRSTERAQLLAELESSNCRKRLVAVEAFGTWTQPSAEAVADLLETAIGVHPVKEECGPCSASPQARAWLALEALHPDRLQPLIPALTQELWWPGRSGGSPDPLRRARAAELLAAAGAAHQVLDFVEAGLRSRDRDERSAAAWLLSAAAGRCVSTAPTDCRQRVSSLGLRALRDDEPEVRFEVLSVTLFTPEDLLTGRELAGREDSASDLRASDRFQRFLGERGSPSAEQGGPAAPEWKPTRLSLRWTLSDAVETRERR